MIKTAGLFLFLLLKILGWILLALLLAFLVALVLIAFVPVRYQAQFQNERNMGREEKNPVKNLQVLANVSWLFHFIHVSVNYGPQGFASSLHLAGIDLLKLFAWFTKRKKHKKKADMPAVGQPDTSSGHDLGKQLDGEHPNTGKQPDRTGHQRTGQQGDIAGNQSVGQNATRNMKEDGVKQGHTPTDSKANTPGVQPESQEASAQTAKKKKKPHKKSKKQLKYNKKEKAASLREKVGRLHNEWKDGANRNAVSHVWREICLLIRSYKPRKLKADITFSLSDPALTGAVLGLISLLPQVYRYPCKVLPDFTSDQIYIEGELMVKGKVTVFVFLLGLLRLIRDRSFMRAFRKLAGRAS